MTTLSRTELAAFVLALGFAVVMQLYFPIFSDEAYLISWGGRPATVYYDHPPLTGWVSALLMAIEHALGWLPHGRAHRIFSLLLYAVSAVLVLRRFRAGWAIFLTLPGLAIIFNMYLNDTLLVFLCLIFFLATDMLWRGVRGAIWPVLLAVSMSLALLTKFLFGIYYIAAVFALLSDAQGRRVLSGPFLGASVFAGCVFAAYLWALTGACSVTLGFNFQFRNGDDRGLIGLLEGLIALAAVGGFGLFAFAFAALRPGRSGSIGLPTRALFWSCVLVLLTGLYIGRIGLHWVLPIGWLLVMAVQELNERSRGAVALWAVIYGWGLLGAVGAVVVLAGIGAPVLRDSLPADWLYELDASYDLSDGSLPRALSTARGDRVLAGASHHLSAAMVNADLPEVTTLTKSVYGRNQDIFTDFRPLDGRDFLILPSTEVPDPGRFRPLFDSVEVIHVETDRRRYQVLAADGLDFGAFKSVLMGPVIENFYDKNRFPSRACFIDRYR